MDKNKSKDDEGKREEWLSMHLSLNLAAEIGSEPNINLSSPNIENLLASSCSFTHPAVTEQYYHYWSRVSGHLSAKYSYIHPLVTNCLVFGAEQVVHSEFIRAFSLKTTVYCSQKRCHESSESEPKQKVLKTL